MKKSIIIAFVLLCMNLSNAQEKLIGSWSLVSITNIYSDGNKVFPYGENPKGLLIFNNGGDYAIQILKAQRLKVITGDKNKCTPEENASIVQGSNSHFGKYILHKTDKTIIFKIESASFPNWEGTEQKRTYSYSKNLLKYIVTNTTQGGESVIAEVVWKKL